MGRFASLERTGNRTGNQTGSTYDDVTENNFIRPMMRNKFNPTNSPTSNVGVTNVTLQKPKFQTDVKALIRTYKKVAYL